MPPSDLCGLIHMCNIHITRHPGTHTKLKKKYCKDSKWGEAKAEGWQVQDQPGAHSEIIENKEPGQAFKFQHSGERQGHPSFKPGWST